jgi:flagellar hook assembly protein FlgD
MVRYGIPGEYGPAVPVSMKIYDVRGREVAGLIDGVRAPGPGQLSWDGTYSNGNTAPSGIYFVDLVAGDSRMVTKLVITR